MLRERNQHVAHVQMQIDRSGERALLGRQAIDDQQRALETRGCLDVRELPGRLLACFPQIRQRLFPRFAEHRMPREHVDLAAIRKGIHDAQMQFPPAGMEQAVIRDRLGERMLEFVRQLFAVRALDQQPGDLQPAQGLAQFLGRHVEDGREHADRGHVADGGECLQHMLVLT